MAAHAKHLKRAVPVLGAAIVIGMGGAATTALADHHHHRGVSAWGKQYLQTAIEGDRFEIAGGKIAQQRGGDAAVKDYGGRLVQDHMKSLEAKDHQQDISEAQDEVADGRNHKLRRSAKQEIRRCASTWRSPSSSAAGRAPTRCRDHRAALRRFETMAHGSARFSYGESRESAIHWGT